MNVASLLLCERLYKLSGWDDADDQRYYGWSKKAKAYVLDHSPAEDYHQPPFIPAYNLGWLLQKLPVWTGSREHGPLEIIPYVNSYWEMKYSHKTKLHTLLGEAKTPEDAACKLLIKLIEEKVITV